MVFVQGGKAADEPLQVLHRKVLGKTVDILSSCVHPNRVFASLQRLHSNPKEVGNYLYTREFFPVGVLKLMNAGHQGFSGRLFFGSSLCVPRSAPLNFLGTVKR
jgi:hypothetical protein